MSTEFIIGVRPPDDGQDWHCQCARCGSSVTTEDCEMCGGEGVDGHDCGEDSCCCEYPERNVRCHVCLGAGFFRFCLSSEEFCNTHPAPGREAVERGTIEWFVAGGGA